MIDRDDNLVLTMTNGTIKHLGLVVGRDGAPGKDGECGKDGRDGLSIEDLSAEFDGERTLILRLLEATSSRKFPSASRSRWIAASTGQEMPTARATV